MGTGYMQSISVLPFCSPVFSELQEPMQDRYGIHRGWIQHLRICILQTLCSCEEETTGHTGTPHPEQQILRLGCWLRRRPDGLIHGCAGISAEGSLSLSGITPSKRLNPRLGAGFRLAAQTPPEHLNIQLSKIDTASCLPLGAQLESTRPRKVLGHTVSDSRIASGWMGVNELLSNCCRFAVTFYLMVNKSSNW